ncbi:hypothetical protein BDV30DRAFT_224396 [Aspergillus minisclerotigenes]|uniref:Ankyrin repeat-containing domain protein n=1 Tax=Aspergillus minisclerotigenes TaxID=656917 RepID=A0A5N6JEI7_9EURO|nr:hypothetical protein BDV30DRAFT_224396 [Aspergillus minisclerotigenes]
MERNTRGIIPARRRTYRQYISSDDDMIKEAASMRQDNVVARQRTPAMLLIKQPKALKQYQTSSFLREAVRYLVYEGEGKLDDGIFHRTNVEPNLISDISQFSSTLKNSIDKANADTSLELLQHKHDHLAQDKDGWCAPDYAARTNNEDVCRTRIRSECLQTSQQSIDTYNLTGATPLQFAVFVGRLDTVRVLLEVTEFLLSSRVQIPRDATAWLKELLCAINWCNHSEPGCRCNPSSGVV